MLGCARVGGSAVFVLVSSLAAAQSSASDGAHPQTASLRVEVLSSGHGVVDASVVVHGVTYRTGADGVVSISVPAGPINIVVVKEGLAPTSASVDLRAGEARTVTIVLEPQSEMEEHVTVSATRTDKLAEDEPMRVDVLDREEIEEKMMMTPGDISMMLNEMGGLRVQSTSPSLGAAGIRIQGMRGRYTRFLSDGLPLFGEQVSSFGVLQIPPADLGHVEVIKGVASSLYGAGAIGGVVNLVSKRPGAAPEHELLVNRSTRGATDGVLWYSTPLSPTWGATLLAGAHGQQRTDVDGDGWADLPKYERGIARPRLFWDNKAGRTFFATAGVTWEDRTGGTMPGAAPPPIGDAHVEALDTRRFDAGAVAQTLLAGRYVVVARGSFVTQRLEHRLGEVTERDTHQTTFGELTLRGTAPRQTWVVGAALERDTFDPVDLPRFAFAYTVPGVFGQDELDLAKWLSISASARVDAHSEYGTFLSPRLAVLFKGGDWSSRVSLGSGFFAASPLIEETEAAGLSRLTVPRRLTAERGESASVDFSGEAGGVRATVTLFVSRVRDPVEVMRDSVFALVNRASSTTNAGLDFVGSWRRGPFSVLAAYAYVRARDGDTDVPLTPRHTAGIDWAWERPSTWRVGLEWYYTGAQHLEANPYRDESRPYTVFGALVLRKIGRYRLFVNGENLTDVRQTHWDPLLRPERGVDGRWTVDAWAPLDGRNINGGVRIGF
jgi:iron complex outermembrane receptor protein